MFGCSESDPRLPKKWGRPIKVVVFRETCISSGNCVSAAPHLFDQDDEEAKVVLLDPSPPAEHRMAIEDAVSSCPVGAISLSGDST
jgi:ferredoxin